MRDRFRLPSTRGRAPEPDALSAAELRDWVGVRAQALLKIRGKGAVRWRTDMVRMIGRSF